MVGEIHTIYGGVAGGGQSNLARKAHARKMQAEEVFLLQWPPKIAKKDSMVISFFEKDAKGVMMPHDDALVVTLTVANHMIHRILVDNGSLADILYWPVFKQMGIDHDRIKPFRSPLVRFVGEQVQPVGLIYLPATVGTTPKQTIVMVDFLIMDQPSAYNTIISRPALNKMNVVALTYHLMMKFPTEEGVRESEETKLWRESITTHLSRRSRIQLLL